MRDDKGKRRTLVIDDDDARVALLVTNCMQHDDYGL